MAVGSGYLVEAGAQMTLGPGTTLSLNCIDLDVQGSFFTTNGVVSGANSVTIGGLLDGGSGVINVGGHWTNLGRFEAGTGLVQFDGACIGPGPLVISGYNIINDLRLSGSGMTYVFPAGQSTLVNGHLDLGVGNRLQSSGPGTAYIVLGPSATVTGDRSLFNVILVQAAPIPTLSQYALLLLTLSLLWLGSRRVHLVTNTLHVRHTGRSSR